MPGRPSWTEGLLEEVNRAFELTGANTPGWPDPHPDRSPTDEEYSRVSDQGKYRILDACVDAWVEVLAARGLAVVTDVMPAEKTWIGAQRLPSDVQRIRLLQPTQPDALGVVIATTLVEGEPFGLDLVLVGAEAPAVLLETVPDCGCDACDSGSADLLEVLDGWILTAAGRSGACARRRSLRYPPD
jgi:Family of unknown function (DUF6226)